jgi:hypothetical protein|tara:strand:- start:186 stop:371 length:186 start_codon:yes stop_codon:yes gene_type:complete
MERRDFLISTTSLSLLYVGFNQKESDNTINVQAASGVPHGSGDLVYVRYAPSYSSYAEGKD